MKKNLLILSSLLVLPVLFIVAQEIRIRIDVPITSEQKQTLKMLRAATGQTNVSLADFATNYMEVQLAAAVTDWRRFRLQQITDKLPACSTDTIDAVMAVQTWPGSLDLGEREKQKILQILAALPTASLTNLVQAMNRLTP